MSEDRYAARMQPVRDRWQARAQDPEKSEQQRAYAHRRVVALGRPYGTKLARCGKAGRIVKCGCPGRRDVRWYTCRQHLMCDCCRVKRAKKVGARIREGLEGVRARAPGRKLVLLTLTLRHSGDVAVDRAALARGWRAFYKRLNERIGRFEYIGVWEVTRGEDELGHVHAHVVASWPWLDWSELAELWRAACPESTRISFRASRNDGQPTSPQSASRYLSKYVSKGVQTADFSPELRADVLAATYNTRWLFSSRHVWVPFVPLCPDCGEPIVLAHFRFNAANRSAFIFCDVGPDPPDVDTQLALAVSEPDERSSGGCAR